MVCDVRVGAAVGHAEQREGDTTGWGKVLDVLPHPAPERGKEADSGSCF